MNGEIVMKRMFGIGALLALCVLLMTCSQAPSPGQGPHTSIPVPAGAGTILEIDLAMRAIFPADVKIEK